MAGEDPNALPGSLDKGKQHADKSKLKVPKLSLRPKSIRERMMPIFENNSKQILKVCSEEMEVVIQKPKLFSGLNRF